MTLWRSTMGVQSPSTLAYPLYRLSVRHLKVLDRWSNSQIIWEEHGWFWNRNWRDLLTNQRYSTWA